MTISLHIRQIGLDLMVFYLTFIKYGMRLYGYHQKWDVTYLAPPYAGNI